MKKSYVINGRFMEDSMRGLVRYAKELIISLDEMLDDRMSVTLLVPPTAIDIPVFQHISVKKIGFCGGIIWEQITLGSYIRNNKNCKCINLCNITPLFIRPGITAILDIMYKVNPSHYTTIRNRLSRLWHMFQYSYIIRHEESIITISNFCKKEIELHYPKALNKMVVIPCGWQHVNKYKENPNWREKYPNLTPNKFFFSLATLSKNKNGKWIIECARKNPQYIFAMAGKHYETEYDDIPNNVQMLGFISDEDACSLIKNCRAFLFPSIYEGFGLPPLEALAQGAGVISSNTASLPEVLGNSAHYIDPYDYDVDLDKLLYMKVENREVVLGRYGWDKSANRLLALLKQL